MTISQAQLKEAVEILKKGGVIVFPTETAYGLGVDATNAQAVRKLMAIKGREGWKTPPLIAADMNMVDTFAVLTPKLSELAERYWPGPLTMVVSIPALTPRYPGDRQLAQEVIRDGTIAIRVSSNEAARTLSRELDVPIVATSANIAGQATCYTLADVHAQFDSRLLQPNLFLDAGPLPVRAPSTIITEQNGQVIVLRQGEIEIPKPYVA